MLCDIYRASSREGMYLYVPAHIGEQQSEHATEHDSEHSSEHVLNPQADSEYDPLASISEALKRAFGRPIFVMRLELTLERKLARVAVSDVIESLNAQSYYLQLPPEGLISPNAIAPEGLRGA